jgi:hypothetical protein
LISATAGAVALIAGCAIILLAFEAFGEVRNVSAASDAVLYCIVGSEAGKSRRCFTDTDIRFNDCGLCGRHGVDV